ncbi:MAG: AAA family ATPase [Magnetococcales bacterium]|nr:AAA family ATPase [Magnetococcales bacterium]
MDQLPLTKRQIEILKLIQSGCSNKEVARRLDISDGTVKQHLVEIFRRLKVNNRTKAAQLVTQAEGGSVFLSPLKENPAGGKTPTQGTLSSASLQPMQCVRVRPRSARELLHRLGGERFNQLNRNLLAACDQAARRCDGVVQGSIEGPLVLFGARFMHEDDPIRAVCCAGLILEALDQPQFGLPLDPPLVEITLYSVQVITCTDGNTTTIQGELSHPEGDQAERAIPLGRGIVLSSDTARALGQLFARHGRISSLFPGCAPWDGHDFTIDEPVHEPPFVGRDSELDELHLKLAKALKGNAEPVLVTGEAGFGATRLVRQLRQETANRPDTRWLTGACHTITQKIPLHPFLPIVESLAQTDPGHTPTQRWQHLEQWIQNLPSWASRGGQRFLALVREQIPLPRMQVGDALHEELLTFLVGIMPSPPGAVILHLDNLQWMDACTRLLMPGLVNRLRGTHVWLLGAGRKAELRALSNIPEIQTLSLLRLPNREILRLLKQMPVAKRLDALQIDLLLEWSRGVPLFAVEIANHLADMKKSTLNETIRSHDLFPESLSCMVMERLNALVGMDWKLIRTLAASDHEVAMTQLLAWNLHGDPQTSETSVLHLQQAGVLKITERGAERFLSFGNEMVRAAIRKTLPESDLVH